MKIHLKEIKKFFLTYQNNERKQHMLSHFDDLIEISAPVSTSKYKSAVLGFKDMLTKGLVNKDVFVPFLMLEDDVAKYREFPNYLTVPDDADLLYIGLSCWGLPEGHNSGQRGSVDFLSVSADMIKITNMLSTHGIIVCSQKGAEKMLDALKESYDKDIVWDIPITRKQKEINTYALKIPLVYQAAFLGGQESPTKIEYREFKDGEKTVSFLV
jgi:hypothetical protein